MLAMLAYQVIGVTVGWHIWNITRDPLALGLIGLAEVIPYFLCAPFSGYAVDHLPRRKLGMAACIGLAATALLLTAIAAGVVPVQGTAMIYVAIGLGGLVRTFFAPVNMSLMARVLRREDFARAAGVSSVTMQ